MPDFFPFAGFRYDRDRGDDLTARVAPPYDVIDEDQRRTLEATHPENAVRLILPRDGDVDGDRYDRAASDYERWCAQGVLVRDSEPRFYGYRMDFTDEHGRARHTLGVVGALALPEPGDGTVLPHERTLPKAKSDRLALLRATRLNLDPIWGLSLTEGLSDAIDTSRPLGECTDEDGTVHSLFAIDDPARQRAIREGVAATPVVLADGHHRFETALNYREERRHAGIADPGADAIMTFVVELADDQLSIEPIHRLLHLPGDGHAAAASLRDVLGSAFTVTDAGPNTAAGVDALESAMRESGALGLVDPDGLALLVPRRDVTGPALAHEPAPVAGTDAALVEAVVVPLLTGASMEYRHDARGVAALVASGVADAALLLRPVSVADTRAAALAGVRMPQKTTFFAPKPRTGMVFRSLD
ncbi:MAG TPA: DUF1015 domain-containing protein [Acidimicrobiia bacterium]|nr:DUF1015 domain-containing protein [Acidimicrobiia bacterium]